MNELLDPAQAGKELTSWKVPEYPQHERSGWWYVLSIAAGLGLFIFALATYNFLFAVIILVAGIIYVFHHHDEPMTVEFSITTKGVILGSKFIPYRELKKFWIVYEEPDVKNLYLDQKGVFLPTLMIPLEKQNPLLAREVLLKYLEEDLEQEEESALERFGRVLKL